MTQSKKGCNLLAVSEAAARRPVKLEWAVRVGDLLTIETQSLGRSFRCLEINETIAGI
jgi:hypothetical protein